MRFFQLTTPFLLVALGACSMGPSPELAQGPAYAPVPAPDLTTTAALPQSPAVATASAAASTELSGFIDPAAVKLLSPRSQTDARNAQFNALQFGRPGAPRRWTGDAGTSGEVTVGPFVRVNNIDCRSFTHEVTAGGQSFPHRGTACREADGTWSVAESNG